MDIMRHKDAVDDIVKTGKAIMNQKSPEEKEILEVISLCSINHEYSLIKSMCTH